MRLSKSDVEEMIGPPETRHIVNDEQAKDTASYVVSRQAELAAISSNHVANGEIGTFMWETA